MAVANRFAYGGALGGLVAADESIQDQLMSRLENQQKALDNADAALTLDLARKYREPGIQADLAKKKQDALKAAADTRTASAEAQVAEQTIGSKVEEAAADVLHTQSLTAAASAQAAESAARTAELPANAASTRAAQAAQSAQALASAAKLNEETKLVKNNFLLRQMEVGAKVAQVTGALENQKTQLIIRKSEVEVLQQKANTDDDRVRIQAAQQELNQQIHNLDRLLAVAENEEVLSRARANSATAAWNAARVAAEASGGVASGVGKHGQELRAITGISDPEGFSGSIVNDILLNAPEWKELRPSEVGTGTTKETKALELRSAARDKVLDAIHRYEQLITTGQITPFAAQDIKRILTHTLLAVHADPQSLKDNPGPSVLYEAQNSRLASLRSQITKEKSPANRAALGQHYSNSVVAIVKGLMGGGYEVPVELLFEFNLIQAQPQPLNVTVRP